METDIRSRVRAFVLKEFLSPDDDAALTDDTSLVKTGVMSSLAMVRLINFFEREFGVVLEPNEAGATHLDTIALMVRTVAAKLSSAPRGR